MNWSDWDYCLDCGVCGFDHGEHFTESKRRAQSEKIKQKLLLEWRNK